MLIAYIYFLTSMKFALKLLDTMVVFYFTINSFVLSKDRTACSIASSN